MLNNTIMSAETLAVLQFEMGELSQEDIEESYDVTDTLDKLEDFRGWEGTWKEFRGTRYFTGRIQSMKGKPRKTFLLIPQGEWNIVVIG